MFFKRALRIALSALVLGGAAWGAGVLEEALAKFRARDYAGALQLTSRGVRENPEDADFLHLHGLTLGALGRFAEAEGYLKKSIQAAPRRADLYHDFGMTLLAQKREKDALEVLKKAVELNPANLLSRLYLGRVYHNLNLSDLALEQFQQIARADAKFPTVHYHIAKIHLNAGQDEEALAELKAEVANFPNNPLPRLEYGEALLKSGQAAPALEQLLAVEKLGPPQGKLYYLMAKAHQAQKDSAQALEAAQRSVRLDPELASARYLLALLYRDAGQNQKAAEQMREFQKLAAAQGSSAGGPAPPPP